MGRAGAHSYCACGSGEEKRKAVIDISLAANKAKAFDPFDPKTVESVYS
jgi:hypothetical protein